MERKLTPDDFKLQPPTSLREVVLTELENQNVDDLQAGKPTRRLDQISDEEIKSLLERIYAHIEKEALRVYHTNEPWALKAWTLEHILEEEIVTEVNVAIAAHLVTPILEWQQNRPFDAIQYYKDHLEPERWSRHTFNAYIQTASRFVGMHGQRESYTDDQVVEYLNWANGKYKKQSSYYVEAHRLIRFLRTLPGGKGRDLPIKVREPREVGHVYQRPMFPFEDLTTLIYGLPLIDIEPHMVIRLLVSTVYGARRAELAQLSSDDFCRFC
jgi:hypothetical protein